MSKPILRIYRPEVDHSESSNTLSELEQMWREQELDRLSGVAESKSVSVPLSKVVPLLLDAAENQSTWLDDFSDELLEMNADLYDVLLAYQQLKKRSAA
jgi:hypothetical protein